MLPFRTYGTPPFTVVVVHGGPGAPGTMAPVARELSTEYGVLEPLQRAWTLEGQLEELASVIRDQGKSPLTLIGSSWGAMLGFLVAARDPELIERLILVGSAVFEERYAAGISDTRLARLDETSREEALTLLSELNDPLLSDKDRQFARLGDLFTQADAYDPFTLDTEMLECSYGLFKAVWGEARELRKNGGLAALGGQIRSSVVAIHGDYDPHPAEGVQGPLSAMLSRFRFVLLPNCGHLPWIERTAAEQFYELLRAELR